MVFQQPQDGRFAFHQAAESQRNDGLSGMNRLDYLLKSQHRGNTGRQTCLLYPRHHGRQAVSRHNTDSRLQRSPLQIWLDDAVKKVLHGFAPAKGSGEKLWGGHGPVSVSIKPGNASPPLKRSSRARKSTSAAGERRKAQFNTTSASDPTATGTSTLRSRKAPDCCPSAAAARRQNSFSRRLRSRSQRAWIRFSWKYRAPGEVAGAGSCGAA